MLMSDNADRVAAVIPPSPCKVPPVSPTDRPGYLAETRRLCDQHGALLIFDEVITGFRADGVVVRRRALRRHAGPHHVRQGRHVGVPAARRCDRRPSGARRAGSRPRLHPAPRLHLPRPSRPRPPHHWSISTSSNAKGCSTASRPRWASDSRGQVCVRSEADGALLITLRSEIAVFGAGLRPDRTRWPCRRPHAGTRSDHPGDRHRHHHVLPAVRDH